MAMKSASRLSISFAVILACVAAAYGQGGWQSLDIGGSAAGSTNIAGGVFTIEGNGTDIWDTADAFRFVYLEGTGDCEIMARVTAQEQTNAWAKAGVMIRQSLAAGSQHAFMCRTPANGMSMQGRQTANGISYNDNGGANAFPRWVWLRRTGNTFTGRYAADSGGQPGAWTATPLGGSLAVTMTGTVYVGLAVTSHENGILSTAVFDNVVTTGTKKLGAAIIIGDAQRPRSPEPPATVSERLTAALLCGAYGLPAALGDRVWAAAFAERRQPLLR